MNEKSTGDAEYRRQLPNKELSFWLPDPHVSYILTHISQSTFQSVEAYYKQLKITDSGTRVLSIADLLQCGFEFVTDAESGSGFLKRNNPQSNIFVFPEYKPGDKMSDHHRYTSEMPIYLAETEHQLSPRTLVTFLDWLTLQEVYFKDSTTVYPELYAKHLGYPIQNLKLTFSQVACEMWEMVVASQVGEIITLGAGPCTVCVAYDPRLKNGGVVHIPEGDETAKSLEKFIRLLEQRGSDSGNLHIRLRGGDSPQARNVGILRTYFQHHPHVIDEMGQVAKVTTLNIETGNIATSF